MRVRRAVLALFSALTLIVLAIGVGSSASAATTCPSFHVLHTDTIGTVKIAAGQYTLVPTGVTCANTSKLLAAFLDDWDGVLPDGWTIVAGKNVSFEKAGTTESFSLTPTSVKPSGGGGGNDTNNGACPGNFTVLHNDKIGALKLKAGQYKITTKGLFCWFDASKLAYFLNYNSSGKLPKPWTINASKMQIIRSPSHYFSLRYQGSSGGGGQHPGNSVRCSKKLFNVSGETLAGMTFPRGYYYLNVFGGLSCKSAGTSFDSFIANGTVPNSWAIDSNTATFMKNKSQGFQLEAAF
jgi:hypothetical protein